MKFLDRMTGTTVAELPDRTLPGRYCVLQSTRYNEHTQLGTGELLLDDGSGHFREEARDHVFIETKTDGLEETESDLASEAIVAIYGKIRSAGGKLVSPMLPAEMAAQCELIEIERDLSEVLRAGHLHSISDRPRQDLRYEDLIAPVTRARRLATSALSHLSSHSDCWQQRTLSGVKPRKILARFSEDDYAIYENRLYKRLIDRLERHLAQRLARIRGISARLEMALEFQDSERTHYRLRQDICRLWGESYLDDKTGVQLEAGRIAFKELTDQLRAVRGLKQRGLYTLVPRTAAVPDQVHRTNILNHDPHYRHLPPLWEKLKDDIDEQRLRPEDRLARQTRLQNAYTEYVGLVLNRALERFCLSRKNGSCVFAWGGKSYSLSKKNHDWLITPQDSTPLRFLPLAWFGGIDESFELLDEDTILCWPGPDHNVSHSQCLSISPLDLYVVERMGRFLEVWLLKPLLRQFGSPIGAFPTAAKQLIDGWPEYFRSVSNIQSILIAPIPQDRESELIEVLTRVRASSELLGKLKSSIAAIEQLSACHCGKVANLSWDSNRPGDFYCQCEACLSTWSLKTNGQQKKFSMKPRQANGGTDAEGFLWAGYDWLLFEMSSP
jgi:hypothetical protein